MNRSTCSARSVRYPVRALGGLALAAAFLFTLDPICAQNASLTTCRFDHSEYTSEPHGLDSALPDAPLPQHATDAPLADQGQREASKPIRPAGRFDKYIEAGQPVPRLSAGDKVVIGLRDSVTPSSMLAWLFAAGYSQALDTNPKYGTNGTAFSQRLGAAAARGTSENVFSDSVLAPLLHQDPRYYRMGDTQPFGRRLAYAGSRILIGRADSGRATANLAKLGGELAGSALAQAYYPPVSRGAGNTFKTFGGSASSATLGYIISEFFPDPLILLRRKNRP